MSADGTRVVLVKPGDILLIGNVGELGPEHLEGIATLPRVLGVRVAVFEGDIDIASVPGGSG